MPVTDKEISSELNRKWPSRSPAKRRRSKLKARYGFDPDVLGREIGRTEERLQLLVGIEDELYGQGSER